MNVAATTPVALALFGGVLVAFQAPLISQLARGLGSPIVAGCLAFLIAGTLMGIVVLTQGLQPTPAMVRATPWWAWASAVTGALYILILSFAVPRIGVASFMTFLIAGQLGMAVLLDHFGALGMAKQEVSPVRVLGIVVVLAGASLVRRM